MAPESSVYLKTLDHALATAATARAADAQPLFAAREAALLARLQALEPAHRLMVARLLFLKGVWHQLSEVVGRWKIAADVDAAVAALEAAGAVDAFSPSSPRSQTLELLPCLVVGDSTIKAGGLREIKAAVTAAAKAAARAGGGTLPPLAEEEKGQSKDAVVRRIRRLAARPTPKSITGEVI